MGHSHLPKLVVFDLDFTLWPFYVDIHASPPFIKRDGDIYDRFGKKIQSYPSSSKVLQHLKELGCNMAIASKASETDRVNELIQNFGWESFFRYKEIHPGCKKTHFESIKMASNINYDDMIFFDDEERNIRDLTEFNVTCVLVRNGMNMEVLEEGLKAFRGGHKVCNVL